MSFAPLYNEFKDNIVKGQFREKVFGKVFQFGDTELSPFEGFTQLICVADYSYRYCNIKKTVAYIVVDEDDYGNPIVQKWNIKSHTLYGA